MNKEWLYHKDTREAKLFEEGEERDLTVWLDSPALCKEIVEVSDTLEAATYDRDALKLEADELGISYPLNIKNERLLNMINEVKGE